MSPRADRPYDLVLFGATGFVGQLTAEQLAHYAPEGATIALAGRSRTRLEQVRAALPSTAADWPIVIADSDDPAALASLATSARVIATTVGPYARHGLPLVQACANAGTHYADLTGEVLFMHRSIARFHETARASGARIVHACGFDSIPSDLGVLALHQAAQAHGTGPLTDAEYVVSLIGGVSGGTVDSLRLQVAELRRQPSLVKLVLDPYALSPDAATEPRLGRQLDLHLPRRTKGQGFRGPFVMGAVNSRVVRRSNALSSHAYGPLRYRESMATGEGLLGALAALLLPVGIPLLIAAFWLPPTRWLLGKLLPSPGQGPSQDLQHRGHFDVQITARTRSGAKLRCRIHADGDPGYRATAVMLSQAALSLAFDEPPAPGVAGVLTPATAMGSALIERLRAAGQTYSVVLEP